MVESGGSQNRDLAPPASELPGRLTVRIPAWAQTQASLEVILGRRGLLPPRSPGDGEAD